MKTRLVHQSIEQLKSKNARAGYHYFEPSTMRFFNSRVSSDVVAGADGWYFVTSEKQTGFMTGTVYPRKYSVRVMREDGSVDTVGDFQAYRTSGAAKRAARQAADKSLEYTAEEDEKRLAELRLSDTDTCPTANGHDLELWERVLQERKQNA